jgi:hypothetical protein
MAKPSMVTLSAVISNTLPLELLITTCAIAVSTAALMVTLLLTVITEDIE